MKQNKIGQHMLARLKLTLLCSALLYLYITPVSAQTIEEIQALDLGRVAILDNTNAGTISINRDSFTSTTGGVRL